MNSLSTIERRFEGCTSCSTAVAGVPVDFPPGRIYRDDIVPQAPLDVLFVGVAPPRRGDHFYTDPADKLRKGLFDVLEKLGRKCRDLQQFVTRRFFLIHTAKCAIKGTSKPDLKVSGHCSSLYLIDEIEALRPRGICWLSKNVAGLVARDLSSSEVSHAGSVLRTSFGNVQAYTVSTSWPGRGWQADTERDLRALFEVLRAV